jgi:hypothetical protein
MSLINAQRWIVEDHHFNSKQSREEYIKTLSGFNRMRRHFYTDCYRNRVYAVWVSYPQEMISA